MDEQVESLQSEVEQEEDHSIAEGIGGRGATGVLVAALLTGLFMIIEFAGGVLTGSVSLLADACYMLVDSAALGFAWLLMTSSLADSNEKKCVYAELSARFGYLMGVILLLGGVAVGGLAIARLMQGEPEITVKWMFWIGVAGLAVNSISLLVLRVCHLSDINAREAMRHVANDIVGSLAVIVAAVAILLGTSWFVRVDAILALAFVALMLFNGVTSIAQSRGKIVDDFESTSRAEKDGAVASRESNVW